MSGTSDAESRIDTAIDRLEKAVLARLNNEAGNGELVSRSEYDTVLRDVDALKRECEQLRTELSSCDERAARLNEAGKNLVDDLDRTIGSIDAIMES